MLIQAALILLCGITSCVHSATNTVKYTVDRVDTLVKQGQLSFDNPTELDAFKHYIVRHKRTYANDYEIKKRVQLFRENRNHDKKYGESWRSDRTEIEVIRETGLKLTKEDWVRIKAKIEADKPLVNRILSRITDVPDEFDWRVKNPEYLLPVPDKGHCGICWAFAFAALLETQYAIQHKTPAEAVSKSELAECSKWYIQFNHTCKTGGFFEDAYNYTKQYGVQYERDYPYRNGNEELYACARQDFNKTKVTVESMISCGNKPEDMKKLLATQGPIMVYVNADQLPERGNNSYAIIRAEACSGGVNHAVVLVGYGVENGLPYWIGRNNWGPTTGVEGYFRIERGSNACGIEHVGYLVSTIIEEISIKSTK